MVVGEVTGGVKNRKSRRSSRKWNHAIQSGDPDKVVALYAEDAILIPTLSPQVRRNHEQIRDYFVHFLKKDPSGRIVEQDIRTFGDIAINPGLYTLR